MTGSRRPVRRVLAVCAPEEPDEVDARFARPFTSSLVLFHPGARPSTVVGRRSLRSRFCVATHRIYPPLTLPHERNRPRPVHCSHPSAPVLRRAVAAHVCTMYRPPLPTITSSRPQVPNCAAAAREHTMLSIELLGDACARPRDTLPWQSNCL